MTSDWPETIDIHQGIPQRSGGALIGGDSYVDDQGHCVAQLDVADDDGGRQIHVSEGDTFELAGATWQVTAVYEPTMEGRHRVATLVKLQ